MLLGITCGPFSLLYNIPLFGYTTNYSFPCKGIGLVSRLCIRNTDVGNVLGSWSRTGGFPRVCAWEWDCRDPTARASSAPQEGCRASHRGCLPQLTPASRVWWLQLLHTWSTLFIRPLFSLTNTVIMEWTFTLVCLCISLVTDEVEHLFI